jgi:hypothetical protein
MCWRLLLSLLYMTRNFPEHSIIIQYKYTSQTMTTVNMGPRPTPNMPKAPSSFVTPSKMLSHSHGSLEANF